MNEELASWVLTALAGYLGIGLLFAVLFVVIGVQRTDPAAQGASWGFRVIIVPGVALFWPVLARRWLSNSTTPPEERSPHRMAVLQSSESA